MTVTSVDGRTWTAGQLLAETRALVEPEHRAAVGRLPEAMRHIAGYHVGCWDAHGRPSGTGGKAVRPALVLAAAAVVGAVALARDAGKPGGTFLAVYNAADEECVKAFLGGRLPLPAIVDTVAGTLARRAAAERIHAAPARELFPTGSRP